MTEELQQLKKQLETIKVRFNSTNELIEMRIKESKSLFHRQKCLEHQIIELESR